MILLQKYSTKQLLFFGIVLQFVSAILLFATAPLDVLSVTVVFIMFYIGSMGMIFGNVISLILENFKDISATANAINGVIGFIIASIIGFIASFIHDGTVTSIFTFMAITSLVSFILLFFITKGKKYWDIYFLYLYL